MTIRAVESILESSQVADANKGKLVARLPGSGTLCLLPGLLETAEHLVVQCVWIASFTRELCCRFLYPCGI